MLAIHVIVLKAESKLYGVKKSHVPKVTYSLKVNIFLQCIWSKPLSTPASVIQSDAAKFLARCEQTEAKSTV